MVPSTKNLAHMLSQMLFPMLQYEMGDKKHHSSRPEYSTFMVQHQVYHKSYGIGLG